MALPSEWQHSAFQKSHVKIYHLAGRVQKGVPEDQHSPKKCGIAKSPKTWTHCASLGVRITVRMFSDT
eukprot:2736060-Amphidinium_carterae.1